MSVTKEELQYLPYFDARLGGRINTEDCPENIREFIKDVEADPIYQEIEARGVDVDLDAVLAYSKLKFGEPVYFDKYMLAMSRLDKVGKAAKLVEAPVTDGRARNADVTYLSQRQIAEREYAAWAGARDTSMSMIRQRAQSDATFGRWYSEQNRLRLNEENKDAITPAGHVAEGYEVNATSDLRSFATDYNQAPSASLAPKQGFITMAGKKYSIARFQELVDLSTRASLL
jgi:hypothetical protein